MSYRDDRDALIARNEQLQAELDAARDEVVRLRGGGGSRSSGWLGGPTRIELERHLEGELTESAIEDLVGILRARFGVGRIDPLGGTISWSTIVPSSADWQRNVAVHFTTRSGRTRIRIEERLGMLAFGLFFGIVGGVGVSGSVMLLVWGIKLANVWLLLGSVGLVALVFGIARAAFGALSNRRARELERLGAELEEAAGDAIADAMRPNVRIAGVPDAGEDEGLDDEAERERPFARAKS